MPDVVHRCYNAVQRGTTWPCTLTAYVACMRCVCVCPTCLTLICAAWEIAWASPRRDRTKRTPKKKNRTPRDAKQEHFWTLTHFTYFYIPSHQLHINFSVRRMAPGTGTHPESKSSNSDPGSRLWKEFEETNILMKIIENMCLIAMFDCKIIQNSIAMASLNGKSQLTRELIQSNSWSNSI